MSHTTSRIIALVNLLGLLGLVIGAEAGNSIELRAAIMASGFVVLVSTFYVAYWRSGIWHFVHRSAEEMDERDLQVSGNSLRMGYTVFTIAALFLLLAISLTGYAPHIITVVSFIYFAHILPALYVVWNASFRAAEED